MRTERATQACADAEALTALARGELDEAKRTALLDHAVGCQRCSDLIALSAELVDWSDQGFADVAGQRSRTCRCRLVSCKHASGQVGRWRPACC